MSDNEIDCMHWFTQTATNYAANKPAPCHFGFGDDCDIFMPDDMLELKEKMVTALRFKDLERATEAYDTIHKLLYARYVEKFSYLGQECAECMARQHAKLWLWHAAYSHHRLLIIRSRAEAATAAGA